MRAIRCTFPQLDLRIVFKITYRLGYGFKVKDPVPVGLRSKIVYQYTCHSCNAVYVGKTSRHFCERIHEHLGISVRTGATLLKPPFSAIREHCALSGHNIDEKCFSILDTALSDLDLLMLESLHIYDRKPSLNTMVDNFTNIVF